MSILVALGLASCVPCDSTFTDSALARRPDFDPEIDACITRHACAPLCRDLFRLDLSIEIERCAISLVEPAVAHVTVEYYDPNACVVDDTGIDSSGDDWWDGGDDGSTDDGSSDDGSSDDGSTDDGSSDDGSTDDGSTDDGSTDDGGDPGDGTSRLAPARRPAHRDATVAR